MQNCPGSPKQQNDKSNAKPPLPNSASQFRKGTYHESLDFVQTLCETSYGLVDIFPVEDRKSALCEVVSYLFASLFKILKFLIHLMNLLLLLFQSLVDINAHIDDAQSSGGKSIFTLVNDLVH